MTRPGIALMQLLAQIGAAPRRKYCRRCIELAHRMNVWGVAGCRRRRRVILAQLKRAYDAAGLLTKLAALGHALSAGLPLTLDGLLDEALRRSETTC
jgi:hypothetical protein